MSSLNEPLIHLNKAANWSEKQDHLYIGVASFGYALLHTWFYLLETESVPSILTDLYRFDMVTGWIALLLFLPVAMTSNTPSVHTLGQRWKSVQRLTYAASIIGFIHILSLNGWSNPWESLIVASPLLVLEAWRVRRFLSTR
ncbi:MAG: ferric reductase-like transmembrane domain-containing protein [Albidovulum sp.]